MKKKMVYEALINGRWQEVSVEKLLFFLLPGGIVQAYRKKENDIEVQYVTLRGEK